MRSLLFSLVSSGFLLAIFGTSAFAQDRGPQRGSPAGVEEVATRKALHDLFDREWEYQLEQRPTRASQLGDRRWNDRWPDVSLESIKKQHDRDRATLEELAKIDRNKLSPQDQLN